MKRYSSLVFSILGILFLIASACEVVGDSGSAGPIDWQNGENIIPANDESLSSEQRERYQMDAEKLAVRHINEMDATQTEVPQELVELYYNGLAHIALSDHPKAVEVAQTYKVHARMPANPREILVQADTTAPWIDAWRNGTTETGYAELDALVDQFDLTLTEYREFEQTLPVAMATLRSGRVINGHAVGALFDELEDIESAGYDLVTDGSDISAVIMEGHVQFTFEYGFGDCPAGCIGKHRWNFEVYRDGSIEFTGEDGDPLPQ